MTRIKRIGGMATIKEREATLVDVVSSIATQVDVLYLCLNGYKEVPRHLSHIPNIVAVLPAEDGRDLSAAGKMIFLQHENSGYAFTLDDDIMYPPDYVENLVGLHERLGPGFGLCVHGSIVPDSASWYYERSTVFDSECNLSDIQPVNLVGSGTFSFRIEDSKLSFADFEGPVQVDLSVSHAFLSRGLPLAACPRQAGWIKFLPYPGITQAFKKEITHHTVNITRCRELKFQHVKEIWTRVVATRPFLREIGAVMDLIQANDSACAPSAWVATPYLLAKELEFSKLWCQK